MSLYSIRVREKDRQRVAALMRNEEPLRRGFGCFWVCFAPTCHRSRKPLLEGFCFWTTPHRVMKATAMRVKQCYWWLWSETAQIEVAKLVPLTERLTGVVAPEGMTEGALG